MDQRADRIHQINGEAMTDTLTTAQQEVSAEQGQIKNSLDFVATFMITSAEDFTFAGECVRDAKANWKRLEARRTAITGPLNAALASVNDLFRAPLASLAQIERVLKGKIGAYTAAQEAERSAVMNRSAAHFAAGGTPTEIIPVRPETPGVSVKAQWDYEIEDPDLVPREYCSPDVKKLNARVAMADTARTPPRPIPGLRFFLHQAVRVRGS